MSKSYPDFAYLIILGCRYSYHKFITGQIIRRIPLLREVVTDVHYWQTMPSCHVVVYRYNHKLISRA